MKDGTSKVKVGEGVVAVTFALTPNVGIIR
jgi:hypothetical protein